MQEIELKNASKKIRAEQERELKVFREGLKQELKLLKQEVDLLPKVGLMMFYGEFKPYLFCVM